MTDQALSPLRRRMIEDMTIRKFAPKTQSSYIRAVKNFTVFLGRAPDQASVEDLRRYQLHLASSGVAAPSLNATVTTLRFFFVVTLGRGDVTERMPFVREPRKLPVILSPEEVARFLEAAPGLKRQRLTPSEFDRPCRLQHIGQRHFPHSAQHHRANLARGFLP